jgi:hypothetical protein
MWSCYWSADLCWMTFHFSNMRSTLCIRSAYLNDVCIAQCAALRCVRADVAHAASGKWRMHNFNFRGLHQSLHCTQSDLASSLLRTRSWYPCHWNPNIVTSRWLWILHKKYVGTHYAKYVLYNQLRTSLHICCIHRMLAAADYLTKDHKDGIYVYANATVNEGTCRPIIAFAVCRSLRTIGVYNLLHESSWRGHDWSLKKLTAA